MIISLFSVYDKKTGQYQSPFTARHPSEVFREWSVIIKDPNTRYGKHPHDYAVFKVGTYDDELAKFETISPPEQVTSDEAQNGPAL